MIGRSVYIKDIDDSFIPDERTELYFTSLHMAEEFNDEFKDKADFLLKRLKKYNKKIMADISKRTLDFMGYRNIDEFLNNYDIDILRIDFGFSREEILRISRRITVGINASTGDYDLSAIIKENSLKVAAVHNFYPRPETGLDDEFFMERNRYLKDHGIDIYAFIAGDINRRGPVYEGLPTLESLRKVRPYVAYVLMKEIYGIDNIIVGDGGISDDDIELIRSYEDDGVITVPCHIDNKYRYLFDDIYTVRDDSPKDVLRLLESRMYATKGPSIEPYNTVYREYGSITLDNIGYQRYSGEIQLLKKSLPEDCRVNVIGKADKEYADILKAILRNSRIRIKSI